ncbi:MAG: hypothetical protein KFW09_01930 [Oscillospiraceae bacterium]|nr:hypothetical protein [Oscillospiraceae bacterium]
MPKKLLKQKHITIPKSRHKKNNYSVDGSIGTKKMKVESEISDDNHNWKFIDDDYSNPSDLLKLPQYTFEEGEKTQNLKSILSKSKKTSEKKHVSFKPGESSASFLENCDEIVGLYSDTLQVYKSIFEKELESNPKPSKEAIQETQQLLSLWSTRAENVYTKKHDFPQEDGENIISPTAEEVLEASGKEKLPLNRKIKWKTRLRADGLRLNSIAKEIPELETRMEKEKEILKRSSLLLPDEKSDLLKSSVETKDRYEYLVSCKEEFTRDMQQQKLIRKLHMYKYPEYY